MKLSSLIIRQYFWVFELLALIKHELDFELPDSIANVLDFDGQYKAVLDVLY